MMCWDDELASHRQKKIMDLLMEENADQELFSNEVKEQAGFGKGANVITCIHVKRIAQSGFHVYMFEGGVKPDVTSIRCG